MISINVSALTHEYNDRLVLDSVSFHFDRQCMVITGSNGSGKSTLMRILAGLVTPSEGSVSIAIDGCVVPRERLHDIIGMAAPDIRLYAELTVRENLEFLAKARGGNIGKDRIAEVLSEVGLADRANDPINELSSGLRQRASLAAAILHDPLLLLLDEPSTNLDQTGIEIVNDLIRKQMERGMVVIATNDPHEAALGQMNVHLGGAQCTLA